MVANANGGLDDARVKDLLNQGFSFGLIKALQSNKECFHYRIWIVDNSGSMAIGDGRTFALTSKGKIEARYVTRWEEIQETVLYHAELAGTLGMTTNFRLLNPVNNEPDEFTVFANGHEGVNQELRRGRNVINRAKPTGVTPLTAHILHIEQQIQDIADSLRERGQRITVVLATDGLPTDEEGGESEEVFQDFIAALRMLEGLPVWVVIRLCTNEKKVTEFYNQIDEVLEFNLEVLDDYLDEAKEVHKHNKWLNYALPMHRCRELGYHDRLFDLLDERKLGIDELRGFFSLLFGTEQHRIPDPTVEWKAFMQFVQDSLEREKVQWDPMRKKSLPWVNVKLLNKIYGNGTCSVM